MATITRKQIYDNPLYEVAIERDPSITDTGLISIRLHQRAHDMPGEVLIAPCDIPDILKALSEASLQIYMQEGFNLKDTP
ncbi:MAG: hypothetical protein Q7W05_11595 [Deltaproteobacteria bacterium]|jgi:hypothetical protein|nr:hypothetical protein [Deltaproteobacteria bacterium]